MITKSKKEKIIGILWLLFSFIFILSLITASPDPDRQILGALGIFINKYFYKAFGISSFFFPILGLVLAIVNFKHAYYKFNTVKIIGLFIVFVCLNIIIKSGKFGDLLVLGLNEIFGKGITVLISISGIIISVFLLDLEEPILKIIKNFWKKPVRKPERVAAPKKIEKKEIEVETKKIEPVKAKIPESLKKETKVEFILPPLSLLKGIRAKKIEDENLKEIEKKLETTLEDFGIEAKVIGTSSGPVITRYELAPGPGVKVSRIANLSNDIALSLKTTEVRIVAPIPEKGAVGIEVPNTTWQTVHIKEILEMKNWNKEMILPIALGKAADGTPIISDLTNLPHLLIAGATGSGKSMCINAIIMSFLYSKFPDQVKLILIDPKRVEFMVHEKLPHLYTPIITKAKEASHTLKSLIKIMEDRYEKFSESGVRDLISFNEKSDEKMPYIVIIIDELAELMLVAAREIEDSITRLAQLARGVGIHLIFATQRPSVDVITGIIKANLPSRIAFQVSSKVDSRTILDENGAETLLGRGDMLFSSSIFPKPIRAQGSFVNKDEIESVVNFIKNQGTPRYHDIFISKIQKEDYLSDIEENEVLKEALLIVKERKRVSTTLLQGALHISGGRATNIVSWMEMKGLIGPALGAKPRDIYLDRIDTVIKKL